MKKRIKMYIRPLLVLPALFCASPVLALSKEKYNSTTVTVTGTVDMGTMLLDSPSRTLKDLVKNYVDLPKGALDWRVLGNTGEKVIAGKDKDGYDFEYYQPQFKDDVKALDGKEVTLKGFMFPLGAAEKQKEFLFGPFPVGCPFHYHVAPALVVEVHADKNPVAFSYDPVIVTGRLELVEKDSENSTFYRLREARLAEVQ
jgi:hypothetical protein